MSLLRVRINSNHFDPPLSDDCICSICLEVLDDPVLTECGHNFCKACIDQSITKNSTCPLDRIPLNKYFPDKRVQRQISARTASCPNSPLCSSKLPLADLVQHLQTCQHESIGCVECKSTFVRKDEVLHMKEQCPKRKQKCCYCDGVICFDKATLHDSMCGNKPLICPNGCGENVVREGMDDHKKERCPETLIVCILEKSGCKERVPRKSMKDHVNDGLMYHLVLSQQRILELEKRMDEQKLVYTELFYGIVPFKKNEDITYQSYVAKYYSPTDVMPYGNPHLTGLNSKITSVWCFGAYWERTYAPATPVLTCPAKAQTFMYETLHKNAWWLDDDGYGEQDILVVEFGSVHLVESVRFENHQICTNYTQGKTTVCVPVKVVNNSITHVKEIGAVEITPGHFHGSLEVKALTRQLIFAF